MSMEEDLLMLLRRTPAISEIVGTRISLDERPQHGNDPAIVISRISGAHEHQLSGGAGFATPVMHVMCFADRAIEVNQLRDQIRMAMQGFSGTVGDTYFGSIVLDDEDHAYESPLDSSENGTYSRLLVFRVLHKESIPAFI